MLSTLSKIDAIRILDLEDTLSDQSLEEFMEFVRQRYGLANISYVCPSFRGRSLRNPFAATTYPDAWREHYREQGYVALDPEVTTGGRSLLPFDWARLPRDDKKVLRMFHEAEEFGVGRQGITIPVRGPLNSLWALFAATSYESDRDWQSRRFELTKDLVHVAHYVHQRACDLHAENQPVDLNTITRREVEALEWSAEGKSVADIAVLMRISPETVKAHLDSARFKLQALNRTHAVTKAIRAGLIH